jgi:hypothetical protein
MPHPKMEKLVAGLFLVGCCSCDTDVVPGLVHTPIYETNGVVVPCDEARNLSNPYRKL